MNPFEQIKHLKTLLIDDNAVVRETLQIAFDRFGCPLKAVATAERGLELLEAEDFDIIISDLRLPGMDGVQFFQHIEGRCPAAVKILISGYGSQQAVCRAFEIGIHAFVKKPFSLTSLLEQIARHADKFART